MSHNRTQGRFFVTHIGDFGAETLIELAKASEIQLDNDVQEVTDVGDNGWKGFEDGLRGWSAPGEINYDQTDTETASLIDNMIDPTKSTTKSVIIGQQTTTGDIAWQGSCKISNITISGPVGGMITMKFQMQGTGGLKKVVKV